MSNLHRINVIATKRQITVQPTRLTLPRNSGPQKLRWSPANPAMAITEIQFDNPNAPITNLTLDPGTGDWTADWDTAATQNEIWKYSLKLTADGDPLPILDPEVENGPPSGGTEDDEEPGGGG